MKTPRMDSTKLSDGHRSPGELRVLSVIPGADEALSMSFSRRQTASISRCGVQVRSFFLRSRTSPLAIYSELKRLRAEIGAFVPDIVHAHFGTMTAFVSAIASRKPLVVTFHGSDLNPAPGDSRLRSWLGHALSHFASTQASQIICVSPQLCERVAYRRGHVHEIPCGVNLERFRPMSRAQSRTKLGWTMDEKIVLFNARTDPIGKRLDLAEAAYSHARRKIANLRLHVFRGATHPDDMPLYYSAADCLLMTSDHEGSPMVVKEAMACNLPVVSVDVGDVAERLTGVVPSAVVARDRIALGDALVEVIRTNCPSNGRQSIFALSEENVARRVISVYQMAAATALTKYRKGPSGQSPASALPMGSMRAG